MEGSVADPPVDHPGADGLADFEGCDTDVALMIARYAGAVLGLLAFTITVTTGLIVQNPITVTLSRSILALFVFCGIGFVLGGAAQLVVAEHEKKRELEIRERYREKPPRAEEAEPQEQPVGTEARATGT